MRHCGLCDRRGVCVVCGVLLVVVLLKTTGRHLYTSALFRLCLFVPVLRCIFCNATTCFFLVRVAVESWSSLSLFSTFHYPSIRTKPTSNSSSSKISSSASPSPNGCSTAAAAAISGAPGAGAAAAWPRFSAAGATPFSAAT